VARAEFPETAGLGNALSRLCQGCGRPRDNAFHLCGSPGWDRLVFKTMAVESPKAQISGAKARVLANALSRLCQGYGVPRDNAFHLEAHRVVPCNPWFCSDLRFRRFNT
jgi:hypothetical protein